MGASSVVRGRFVLGWLVALQAAACSGRTTLVNSRRDTADAADVPTTTDAANRGAGDRDAGPDAQDVRADASDAAPRDAATDGAPATPTVRLPPGRSFPAMGSVTAIVADDRSVSWLTVDDGLWTVDLAADAQPRSLAPGGWSGCPGDGPLALGGDQLFWVTRSASERFNGDLHRTSKSGDDAVLVSNAPVGTPIDVLVDDERVYWAERGSGEEADPGGLVRALPTGAAPGDAARTIVAVDTRDVVAGVSRVGSTLFWVDLYVEGTTMFWPSIDAAPIQALLDGDAVPSRAPFSAWLVRGYAGDLYYAHQIDIWHDSLTRVSGSGGTISDLAPIAGADEIAFVDGWALVSTPAGGCGNNRHNLIAVPLGASGGPTIRVADQLLAPAVVGGPLVVAGPDGQVHVIGQDEVRAALAAGIPAAP